MSTSGIDFGVGLSIAHATFHEELARRMAAAGYVGFNPRQGAVLRLLEAGPLSLRDLASRLRMTSPGALKLVAAMAEVGYVERAGAPSDRRVRLVHVTPRGHEAVAAARQVHAKLEAELVDDLGADVVAGARAVLQHLADRAPASVPRGLGQRPTG